MKLFGKLANILGLKKKEVKILILGLNNSGKSTLVNHLKSEEEKIHSIVPTVGLNIEKFKYHNVGFTAFDMSGHGKYRNLWQNYYQECEGIIFVIDSSDTLRIAVVRDELDLLLQHPDIVPKRIPILFFANKIDLKDSLSPTKIASILGLKRIKDKPWHICGSNALNGEGLQEGSEWFTQAICEILK